MSFIFLYQRTDRRKLDWEVIVKLLFIVTFFVFISFNLARWLSTPTYIVECSPGYQLVSVGNHNTCVKQ